MPPLEWAAFFFLGGLLVSFIGCLVPSPPWAGKVAGVFRKAVAVLHSDGALVSIVAEHNHLEARAMLLDSGWQYFAHTVQSLIDSSINTNITWDGSALTITTADGIAWQHPRIYPGSSSIWDPRLRTRAQIILNKTTVTRVIAAIEYNLALARANGKPAEGIHGDGIFRSAFNRLRSAVNFPANLVGFGPGMTPTGDDWLAGFLAGCDLAKGGHALTETSLRSMIVSSLDRTTPAGRALLLGAVAGAPPAYIERVTIAVETYFAAADRFDKDSVKDAAASLALAVQAALKHGATSGEDALAGFMDGLRHSAG